MKKHKTKKKKVKPKQITKKISMSELLMKYPEAVEVLFESNMGCIGCPGAMMETLEQGCLVHGINPDEIVKKINLKLKKKK